jgi:hypothetical protein
MEPLGATPVSRYFHGVSLLVRAPGHFLCLHTLWNLALHLGTVDHDAAVIKYDSKDKDMDVLFFF